MREGTRFGLIDDPEARFKYRRMRNITSHTYDEATAEKVAGSAKSFIEYAKILARGTRKDVTAVHLEPRHLVLCLGNILT